MCVVVVPPPHRAKGCGTTRAGGGHPCPHSVASVASPFPGIRLRWGCSGGEAAGVPGAASPGCGYRRRHRMRVPEEASDPACVPPRGAAPTPPQTPVAPGVPCPLRQLRSPSGSGFCSAVASVMVTAVRKGSGSPQNYPGPRVRGVSPPLHQTSSSCEVQAAPGTEGHPWVALFQPPSGISAEILSLGAILRRVTAAPGAPVSLSQHLSQGG